MIRVRAGILFVTALLLVASSGSAWAQVFKGQLESSSGVAQSVHELTLSPGERVGVMAQGGLVGVTLRVEGPGGFTREAGESPAPGAVVQLSFAAQEAGTYRVIVRAAEPGRGGPYSLAIDRGSPAGGLGMAGTPAEVHRPSGASGQDAVQGPGTAALRGAGTFTGRLQQGDAQISSGEFVHWYDFEGPAGQGVTITLESNEFDTYLMLRGPDGYSEDNDDGPGMGLNSRLEVGLPSTGVYRIGVTSYAPGEVGAYTLRITEGTTLQNARRPDVYAVLAGMSEYPNPNDHLAWCAEDALRLHQALAATGRLAPVSVVLTDRQVTRANLRDAVTRVAAAAGPDDVFIFFFSGHGNQVPALADDELDGLDEVLSVWDGNVRDREVAEWFDHSNARLSILALDACHAGGFARDVISAPGRMGIFSSEEDVTSLVAQNFEAGGYLSHFLRQAFEGAADVDPRDGVLTAGELTQYLRRQWAEHVLEVRASTGDGRRSFQNLVIVRGAVHVDEIVL